MKPRIDINEARRARRLAYQGGWSEAESTAPIAAIEALIALHAELLRSIDEIARTNPPVAARLRALL